MSADYFIYNGIDTRDFNAQVFRPNVETVGPQLYTTHEVPGRNGDILLPKGKYPNRRERYSILCTGTNAVQHMDDLKNALLYQTGYQRLTDSFDTDVYYQAALTDQFDIEYTRERDAAKCQIAFNRMPQKFFVSGDTRITIAQGGSSGPSYVHQTITNPSIFKAKPLIQINAYGILRFDDWEISNTDVYNAYIDCASYEIYRQDGKDYSSYVTISGGDFPVLDAGDTTFEVDHLDGHSNYYPWVGITQRWWKL